MTKIEDIVEEIARSYKGRTEIKGNLGFKNKPFWEKMLSVGFRLKDPWCMYYVELVWIEAYKKIGAHEVVKKLTRLFSASATRTLSNFKKAGYVVNKTPKKGSIAIFQKFTNNVESWKGHGLLVLETAGNWFESSEGNTREDALDRDGGKVCEKDYHNYPALFEIRTGLRLIGFIHLKDYITDEEIKKLPAYEY